MLLTDNTRHLLDVPITRLPLTLTGLTFTAPSPFEVFYHTGQSRLLGLVEKERDLPTHYAAVDRLTTALREIGQEAAITAVHRVKQGVVVYVHCQLTDLELDCSDEEPGLLIPEIILRNGYDGTTLFGVEFGFTFDNEAEQFSFRINTAPHRLEPLLRSFPNLVARLHEYTTTGLERLAQQIAHLQDVEADDLPHFTPITPFIQQYWSNVMLQRYYRDSNNAPLSAWRHFLLMHRIAAHRTASLKRRDNDLVLANGFDLVWRVQSY